ncbi:MAG: homoserine O-succinyltransferase [Acutalibacteraceae bacterium]
MPIRLPNGLPASETLKKENIFVADGEWSHKTDIRPLRIIVLNLMPTKIATETQLARLLGGTPLRVDMELLTVKRKPKNTAQEHMEAFYKTFDEVKSNYYDGFIITGTPVEKMEFEQVDFWPELCEMMEWSKTHVKSTMYICWGAQAGLYYHYGIPKQVLTQKMFGVFEHKVNDEGCALMHGFDDIFLVPHSRHSQVSRENIESNPSLKIISESADAGVYIVSDKAESQFFITGHSEYDVTTLHDEYQRDKTLGLPINHPVNYYLGDDETAPPLCTWRAGGNLLFLNWLNYYVADSNF